MNGVVITGYPGAGKSIAGEMLSGQLDAQMYETGDVVRQGAARHFDMPIEELSSDKLGDYSTMRRETDGGDYVIQDVFDNILHSPESHAPTTVISGLRDTEAPSLCEEFFDNFLIVWIQVDFDTRLHRLQDRGRQDEASFTAGDLEARDKREDGWGTGDLYEQRDVVVNNTTTLGELYRRLQAVEYLLQ